MMVRKISNFFENRQNYEKYSVITRLRIAVWIHFRKQVLCFVSPLNHDLVPKQIMFVEVMKYTDKTFGNKTKQKNLRTVYEQYLEMHTHTNSYRHT